MRAAADEARAAAGPGVHFVDSWVPYEGGAWLLEEPAPERPRVLDRRTPALAAAVARKAIRKLLR